MDLLRSRIGAAGRDGNGRVAPSPLGRIAGASDDAAPGHQFPGAARPAHGCSTWRARRTGRAHGCGRSMSRAECRPGCRRASINTRRCRPAATAGASSPPSPTPARACGGCRCSTGSPTNRDAKPYPLPVPTGLAFAPRFGRDSLFYLSARGTGDGLWKVQDGKASQVRRGVDGALSEPPAVSPDGSRLAVVVRKEGKRHLSIMSADGTNAQTLAASIEIEGAAGQGAADWSPDGTRIVTGGRDEKGPALFIIPVDTRCARPAPRGQVGQSGLVAARRSDCLCRPVGHRPGRTSWSATGWHAGRAAARARPPGRLSLPARRHRIGVPGAHSVAGFLAVRFRDENIPSSSRAWAIRAPCGRSTSRLTGKSIVFDRVAAELEHRPDRIAEIALPRG